VTDTQTDRQTDTRRRHIPRLARRRAVIITRERYHLDLSSLQNTNSKLVERNRLFAASKTRSARNHLWHLQTSD